MPTLPFLYLPDAVTLILLLVALGMLRRVAIIHISQELLIIRKEMISFWLNRGLEHKDAGYIALRALIDSSIRIAPRLSPARLMFVYRFLRPRSKRRSPVPVRDPAHEVGLCIDATTDRQGREKLKRLQMEMNLGMGTFFLMGSVSGWALLLVIVPRILKRSIARHANHSTDAFFDMTERVLSRFGRRAQRIGFASQSTKYSY